MKQKSEIKRTGPELLKRLLRQREMSVFLIILLVVAIVAIVNPKFIQPSNMKSIALSVATDGLLSIGLTLALILGGIELSVGGVAAMTCVIAGQMALMGVNIWVACLAALAAGAVCGLFNGFMVSKVGLPPFIVTLSMMNLSRGVAYIITTGSPLSVSGYLPDSFRFLATGDVFGIPVLFLIFLLVTVVALIFTKKSNACRNIYYVGSNENAAKLSGINVDRVKIFVYVVIRYLCRGHRRHLHDRRPGRYPGHISRHFPAEDCGLCPGYDECVRLLAGFRPGRYPGHRRYHRLYEPPKKRQQLPPAHAGPGAQETCPAAVIRDPAPGAGAGNTAKKNKRRNPQ